MDHIFPTKSNLVSDLLEDQLKQLFARLEVPVEFTCILDGGKTMAELTSMLAKYRA